MSAAAAAERFTYGIAPRTLLIGIACLASCLVLLLALALDGLPAGPLWWVLTGIVALALGLSVVVAVATRRAGPTDVVLHADALDVPAGAVGTRTRRIPFESIRGLRVVGRASMVRRDQSREVLYIVHDERYSVLMSEMFESWSGYVRCRDQLIARVRRLCPEVRVDIDGRPLGQGSDASRS